ncbi:MAG: polysaccharide deacetylase family protein [Planctomycetota bacterium]
MNARPTDVTFAPVTREQALLFAGIARRLDSRGVRCRLAAPSREVAEHVRDEWGTLIETPEVKAVSPPSRLVPSRCRFQGVRETAGRRRPPAKAGGPSIGAYDAWRAGWPDDQRAEQAAAAVEFWRQYLREHQPRAVVLWNGRDHLFVEAAACAAREHDVSIICMELGPLRNAPMTVAVSRGGINAAAEFRRPDKLSEPLVPWETRRLQAARVRFKANVTPHRAATPAGETPTLPPFAFLPLQVDDDTQLYYYAPHFTDQRALLKCVVEHMPNDLPLRVKLHPLCDPRFGPACYAPLLRQQDCLSPPSNDTLALIASAAAVITTNSSAGVEALMLEKPVVVLGEAHYRGRGFTFDFDGKNDLGSLVREAASGQPTHEAIQARDRYLYELLFHELVQIDRHPLRAVLPPEELDRIAVRLWDLVQPEHLGSNWAPLFREVHSLRQSLSTTVREALRQLPSSALLVATRFAAACLADLSGIEIIVLEDLAPETKPSFVGRDVFLLAPDLSPGQTVATTDSLRESGARTVHNLMHDLSRQPCSFHVDRFNQLPTELRDELYRNSDYWDYYLTQSGILSDNTPEKTIQAETITKQVWQDSPASVLEYGCGDGRIMEKLAAAEARHKDATLTGVDSSDRMLQLARQRVGGCRRVRLLPADARDVLPFDDHSFDTTLTCGALQHVHTDDLPSVVAQLHRVTQRTMLHWEVFEAHQPIGSEHYTNADTSLAVHRCTFERFGPVETSVRDVRPLTGQASLLAQYNIDRPLLTVLTLHAVGTPDPTCDTLDYRNMFITPRDFEELLDGLLLAEYRFISLREAIECSRGDRPTPHKAIILTFDDGYASVFDVARPLCRMRDIRPAVFIPTGHIAGTFTGNSREGDGPPLPTMTPDQLRELHHDGWDIGAHSVSHPVFASLSDEQARRELGECKFSLEALLGCPVTTFAFPYGEPDLAYRPEHVKMAADAGYELVLTMRPGSVRSGHGAIDWPRVGVDADTTAESLVGRLAELHRVEHGWPVRLNRHERSLEQRVRSAVCKCVDLGIERIALYGAGRHTAKLLQTTSLWPLQVLGIFDDDTGLRGGKRYGLPVYSPADIANLKPQAVIISSDQYENAIYERIAPLEARGIRVLKLHGENTEPSPVPSHSSTA